MGLIQGESMDRRFFHRIGASLLDRTICASAGAEALNVTYGTRMAPDPEDIVDAKLILLWGTNTLTSNPHLWPFIRKAKANGARRSASIRCARAPPRRATSTSPSVPAPTPRSRWR
jgi:anaerobic selenocysteine-containing dehydrogenase